MSVESERVDAILSYLIEHSEGHEREHEKWLHAVEDFGNNAVTREIREVVKLSRRISEHAQRARVALHGETPGVHVHTHDHPHGDRVPHHHIQYHQIGVIRTPYTPDMGSEEMRATRETTCRIVVQERFAEGLWRLESFSHIIILFHLDRVAGEPHLAVSPPWAGGARTGLFASRSPMRPNPIGLCIVGLREVRDNVIHTDNIDAYDGTPLLDIKPYLEALDSRVGAGNGWIDELDEEVRSRAFS
jgi:tRNA-Thr(GGU) m(6)t(6)A37 methyltransferase TsaA